MNQMAGVNLVLFLNSLMPDLGAGILDSKGSLQAYSQFEYSRAASAMRPFGVYSAMTGKDVLDIGCGLGGSERYYLEQGARSVTAVDLNRSRLRAGTEYVVTLAPDGEWRFLFAAADARRISFGDEVFDLIVSTNTFEHIFGVEAALRECARVLRPGGHLLVSFPPYKAPWAAHLGNWIRLPWCQVLFTEEALVQAAQRIEAKQQLNAWIPEALRLDLDGCQEIPHLNRMSIDQFETIVGRVPLKPVLVGYQGLGWRAGGLCARIGRVLALSHRLREYVTSQAVYVLEKAVA